LRELYDLLPPDPDRIDFLFETALRGQALEKGGEFAEAKSQTLAADALQLLPAAAADAPAAPAPAAAVAGKLTLSRRGLEVARDEVAQRFAKDGCRAKKGSFERAG
jgi:hypothetical protein